MSYQCSICGNEYDSEAIYFDKDQICEFCLDDIEQNGEKYSRNGEI